MVRHLRYFLAVAEEGHVGHAADRLGIAQPALSQRLRRLEAELGARLFDRTSRGMVLTPAGEVLAAEAEALLDRFDHLRAAVGRAARGDGGTLRLGVPPQVPGGALAAALAELAAERPGLRVDLHEASSDAQRAGLRDGSLDAGLVHLPAPSPGPGLVAGPTVEVPLGVVVPRPSPLARRTELRLADLAGSGVVVPGDDPALRDATLAGCRAGGFVPARVREAAQPEVVLALVVAGEGVAFDSGAIARKEPRVAWRPLAPPGLAWRLAVVWPAERPHPAAPAVAAAVAAALAEAFPPDDGPATTGAPAVGPWAVVNPAFGAGR